VAHVVTASSWSDVDGAGNWRYLGGQGYARGQITGAIVFGRILDLFGGLRVVCGWWWWLVVVRVGGHGC
jgi:hypothetical protein